MVYREFEEYISQFLVAVHIIDVILCWGMIVENNMTPATSECKIRHPNTDNSTSLTAHMILLCKKEKKTCPLFMFIILFFQTKTYVLVRCHYPHMSPAKSNLYFDSSFATVVSEPKQYRLRTFGVPNFIHIFLSLGRLSKQVGCSFTISLQVLCPMPNA
jgi:hypothetical protein